ncbi:hypothetical protein [Bordetella sp. BOR01]|uniref:hypothetical protein n=1 Tax=Bordetella sp. BOR01 TaxID=2854779 RepID=UPI001C484861|nr:hypothetical protein [Bordetella sp. BOR01]MBV7482481.1 hypothetical protein [Bordetella sp. BOR01]
MSYDLENINTLFAEIAECMHRNPARAMRLLGKAKEKVQQALERATSAAHKPGDENANAAPLYYLQDSRGYVGNCPMWSAKGGNGYTTRLDQAQRYTFDDAMRQHRSRPSDVPWPCDRIDGLRRPTVDTQDMGGVNAQVAALSAQQCQEGN